MKCWTVKKNISPEEKGSMPSLGLKRRKRKREGRRRRSVEYEGARRGDGGEEVKAGGR